MNGAVAWNGYGSQPALDAPSDRSVLADLLPLVADLHDAVLILDAGGSCLFANPQFERVVGRSAVFSSVDGIPAWIDLRYRHRWSAMLDVARTRNGHALSQLTVGIELVTDGGAQPVEVTWSSVYSDGGDLVGVLVIVRPPDGAPLEAEEESLVETLWRLEQELPDPYRHDGEGQAPASEPAAFTDPRLSHRENQVVAELLTGARAPEIAARLFLSEHTVRNHVKRIYRKLGVHSSAELRRALGKG